MKIFVNPGSGPVEGATEGNAIKNIDHFIVDSGLKNVKWIRVPDSDDEGRYGFLLYRDDGCMGLHHWVEMPGLPLDRVRYMKEEGQNIWHYPRLYVDGSSWVWCFGLLEDKDFDVSSEE